MTQGYCGTSFAPSSRLLQSFNPQWLPTMKELEAEGIVEEGFPFSSLSYSWTVIIEMEVVKTFWQRNSCTRSWWQRSWLEKNILSYWIQTSLPRPSSGCRPGTKSSGSWLVFCVENPNYHCSNKRCKMCRRDFNWCWGWSEGQVVMRKEPVTSSFEDHDGFARMDVDASTRNTEPQSSTDDCDREFLPRNFAFWRRGWQ